MKASIFKLLFVSLILVVSSCEDVDDTRIPLSNVNIVLDNQGYWDTWGVHGYGDYRYFIKGRQPSNFPWTGLSYTGYGGVLLVMGYENGNYNVPLAYDMACPVERNANVRVEMNSETFRAVCLKCGSEYDVCEGAGRPLSGEAVEKNYGLTRYKVFPASYGGYIIVN